MDRVKICPKCGAEYYPDILNCADCGVALVWPEAQPMFSVQEVQEQEQFEQDKWWGIKGKPKQKADSDGWEKFTENEILGQVTRDREGVINTYRTSLAKAGIPAAILPVTRYDSGEIPVGDLAEGFQYDLFVRQMDYERAEGITEDLFAELHPGQEGGFINEFELGKCPACGADVPPDAAECPDCGLPLA